MKILVVVCCLLGAVVCGACQSQKSTFQSVSVDEFEEFIQDPTVQRLDVRTLAEYSEGHIPGSFHVNVLDEASFVEMAEDLLQKEQPVALYCRSGKRSKKAAKILVQRGYQVYELDGGYNAWKAADKKIEK